MKKSCDILIWEDVNVAGSQRQARHAKPHLYPARSNVRMDRRNKAVSFSFRWRSGTREASAPLIYLCYTKLPTCLKRKLV